VQLIAWSTLYGAFLGVAVPAMLDIESPEPYGVGLLTGGPIGFTLSRSYAARARPTAGKAAAMTFGFRWGAYQAAGWRGVFEIGSNTVCEGDVCFTESPGRAPWTAMVLGGLGGMTAGALLADRLEPTNGRVTFAAHGGYWGTWLGLVLGNVTDQSDDNIWTTMLVVGDVGVLAGAVTAPPNITAGRVWVTTAMGIAGAAAGFGVDLIVQPEDATTAIAIPGVTSVVGLLIGWAGSRGFDAPSHRAPGSPRPGAAQPPPAALLDRCGSCNAGRAAWRLAAPPVSPRLAPLGENARGRRVYQPALAVPLLHAEF
jgi:hypothetical protein